MEQIKIEEDTAVPPDPTNHDNVGVETYSYSHPFMEEMSDDSDWGEPEPTIPYEPLLDLTDIRATLERAEAALQRGEFRKLRPATKRSSGPGMNPVLREVLEADLNNDIETNTRLHLDNAFAQSDAFNALEHGLRATIKAQVEQPFFQPTSSAVLPQEAEDDAFIAGQGMGNLNFAEGFEEFDLADMVLEYGGPDQPMIDASTEATTGNEAGMADPPEQTRVFGKDDSISGGGGEEALRPTSSRSDHSHGLEMRAHSMLPNYLGLPDSSLPPGSVGGPLPLPATRSFKIPTESFAWDTGTKSYTAIAILGNAASVKMESATHDLRKKQGGKDCHLGYLNRARKAGEPDLDNVCNRCRKEGKALRCSNNMSSYDAADGEPFACDACITAGSEICGAIIAHPTETGYAVGYIPVPENDREGVAREQLSYWETTGKEESLGT